MVAHNSVPLQGVLATDFFPTWDCNTWCRHIIACMELIIMWKSNVDMYVILYVIFYDVDHNTTELRNIENTNKTSHHMIVLSHCQIVHRRIWRIVKNIVNCLVILQKNSLLLTCIKYFYQIFLFFVRGWFWNIYQMDVNPPDPLGKPNWTKRMCCGIGDIK